ncbi:MAG: hypothetical protein ACLP8A_11990 [Methylovirgula sp.]
MRSSATLPSAEFVMTHPMELRESAPRVSWVTIPKAQPPRRHRWLIAVALLSLAIVSIIGLLWARPAPHCGCALPPIHPTLPQPL